MAKYFNWSSEGTDESGHTHSHVLVFNAHTCDKNQNLTKWNGKYILITTNQREGEISFENFLLSIYSMWWNTKTSF